MTRTVDDEQAEDLVDPLVIGIEPFERFYRREYQRAVRLAVALSGSRLGSEDLAQEAFIEAHRRWDEIGRYSNPAGWVRRVVANRSVSRYRRSRAEAKALLKLAAGSRQTFPEFNPETTEVWNAVRRLPNRQAQVVALTYLEGMTLREISEILGISVPTAGTHLQRARATLAKKLSIQREGFE